MGIGELAAWQWAGAGMAAFLVGASKAGFGAGPAMLAVPLMAAVVGPARMLGIMLPVLLIGDVFSLVHYRREHDRRNLAMLIPGLVVGVGAGYVALDWFLGLPESESWMKRMIGFLCVSFVTVQVCRIAWQQKLGAASAPYRPRAWHGVGLGALAGLTSTLAHGGGPVIDLFLLPQNLAKRVFVGTAIRYFFVGNLIKLVPYFQKGLLSRQSVFLSLLLLPCVAAGTLSGVSLNRRFSERAFRIGVYSIALCMGLYLLSGWEPGRGEQGSDEGELGAFAAFQHGLQAYGRGDYGAALAAFQRAAPEEGPWCDRARFNSGLAFYQQGRCKEAGAALALLCSSADAVVAPHARFNCGNSAYRSGQFAEAAEWYAQAVDACQALLGSAHDRLPADERAGLGEVLRRAQHNLILAQAQIAAAGRAEQRLGPGQAQREAPGAAARAAQADVGEGTRAGRRAPVARSIGYSTGPEAGARTVDAVLASVMSRDTGAVLPRQQARAIPEARNW